MATFVKHFNSDINNSSQIRVHLEELPTISERFEEFQSIKEELEHKADDVVMDERLKFNE